MHAVNSDSLRLQKAMSTFTYEHVGMYNKKKGPFVWHAFKRLSLCNYDRNPPLCELISYDDGSGNSTVNNAHNPQTTLS